MSSIQSKLNQPSSSNSIQFGDTITPNWDELPQEIWFLILSKLNTIDIIENVQKVCMLFRKICKQPSMFKVINMTLPGGDAFQAMPYSLNAMTRFAVDRSGGGLIDIYMEYLCDDDTLMYIVQRCKNLKHLRLAHHVSVSDGALIEAVKNLPMLEEVQIIICSFSATTVEAIGHACPTLTSFGLTGINYRYVYDREALAISVSMPNLRHLQLTGSNISSQGLEAILDGCPHLESLDLRACFGIYLAGDLSQRCERIKHVRYPNDSTADYGHHTCDGDDYYFLELQALTMRMNQKFGISNPVINIMYASDIDLY